MPVLAAVLVLKMTSMERTLALRVEPPCHWLAERSSRNAIVDNDRTLNPSHPKQIKTVPMKTKVVLWGLRNETMP